MTQNRPPFVLVTGPSGAGRSTALNAREDLGFEAIDNLPRSLLPRLLVGRPSEQPLALTLDPRNSDFGADAPEQALAALRADPAYASTLLYLDCRPDVLLRRFSETRRRHPFSQDGAPTVGIRREQNLLIPLRDLADHLIDTSDMTPHELRAVLAKRYGAPTGPGLQITVESFSYKRGLPQDIDTAFDARFLSNPHWVEELRPLDGRDPRVAAHVAADPRYAPFYDRVLDLVRLLLPAYLDEGKTHLSIGFGCTGGRHRSVTLAEKLGQSLADDGWRVSIRHRNLERTQSVAHGR